MTDTFTPALLIDLVAAHYQIGARGLHALVSALAGKRVCYVTSDGTEFDGALQVSECERTFDGLLGFTLAVHGRNGDFIAVAVRQDEDGNLDRSCIGTGDTLMLR